VADEQLGGGLLTFLIGGTWLIGVDDLIIVFRSLIVTPVAFSQPPFNQNRRVTWFRWSLVFAENMPLQSTAGSVL